MLTKWRFYLFSPQFTFFCASFLLVSCYQACLDNNWHDLLCLVLMIYFSALFVVRKESRDRWDLIVHTLSHILEPFLAYIRQTLFRPTFWLNCRIPSHFKANPKDKWIRGYADTQSLRIRVSTLSTRVGRTSTFFPFHNLTLSFLYLREFLFGRNVFVSS